MESQPIGLRFLQRQCGTRCERTSASTQLSNTIVACSRLVRVVASVTFFAISSLWFDGPGRTHAADLDESIELYRTGEYEKCIEVTKAEVERSVWNEGWPKLLIECYLTTGKYEEAVAVFESNIERFSTSLRLRMLGAEAYRLTNNLKQARTTLQVVPELVARVPWRFTSKSELIALGEYYLAEGEDPKQVLELCFDKVTQEDPQFLDAHLASARLAISKNDSPVALASLKKAVAIEDKDPEVYYLLARAWNSSDPEQATLSIRKAMEINPRHIPSLLWLAEIKLDSEAYTEAEEILGEIESINSKLPAMWALRSAMAHLQGKFEREGATRRLALMPWPLNPEVDYRIGKCLADHYRFSESADYQRRALVMNPNYLPAKAQLAQDLLRLGELEEGWKAVAEVRDADPYDVPIFNLTKLRARLASFATLEAPGLIVRMDKDEAAIFGRDVVAVLSEVRQSMVQKYQVKLKEPVYVEIFPKQSDFAIRTFGIPGGDGFLGVCFGRLITANSPSALDIDSNWRSVLWHEYCHVVTLQKTKNRMPRWLSEGISVYEERQRDKRWGEQMSPTYRQMILGDDLTPVSKLSSAFLRPKSPLHLQFAYYEASLVVEYWMETYGLKAMLQLLNDLSVGMPIEEALARHSGGLEALDSEFAEYAKKKAEAYGGGLDFSGLKIAEENETAPKQADAKNDNNQNSYTVLVRQCMELLGQEEWEEALPLVQRLVKALPDDGTGSGGQSMLCRIYRELDQADEERAALVGLDSISPNCIDALLRLIEIDQSQDRSEEVLRWCDRALEINPLSQDVHTARVAAAEKLKEYDKAVQSLEALSKLEPIDPAGIQYRLARNLFSLQRNDDSKRAVLMALEESPRYRDALKLLVAINGKEKEIEKAIDEIRDLTGAQKETSSK